jgi:hypothetical protein
MRISTTDLEQLRLVKTTTWASEESLLAKLRGEGDTTWNMHAGKAWGEILEGKGDFHPEDQRYHFSDCSYSLADVQLAKATIPPGGVHECKAVVETDVDGEPVQVVAKVDYVFGSEITEFKCKWDTLDYSFYEQSLQWRFYLWAFGASSVTYRLFRFLEPDRQGRVVLADMGHVRFWPYPGLDQDCRFWIREFAHWALYRGVDHLLPLKAA